MFKSIHPVAFGLAASVLLGGLAFASPVLAQQTQDPQTAYPEQSSPLADTPAPGQDAAPAPAMHKTWKHDSAMAHHDGDRDVPVETRIKTLHDKLGVTAAQEGEWKNVADAMRDNEKQIHGLIKERRENAGTMTAVDDLESYKAITQAHVDGLNRLISVFGTLYNDMSDAQKKNADNVFGKFEGHHDHAAKKPVSKSNQSK